MNKLLLCLLLVVGSLYVKGEEVSEKDAKIVALNWLNNKKSKAYSLKDIEEVYLKASGELAAFYIVNFSPKGWVMVAATDKVEPILAYSTETTFSIKNVPVQLEEWLKGIGKELELAQTIEYQPASYLNNRWQKYANNIFDLPSLKSSIAVNTSTFVDPLLSCTWAQGRYYNEMAPEDPKSAAGNGHVWIGCVATAYAQLMKYWEYPQTGDGYHFYRHNDYGIQSANFSETTYNWASMPDNLTTQNEEVQRLCYHAAVAVDMDFDPVGSGAFLDDTQNAMIEYFRYNATIFNPSKNSWDSDQEWKDAIKSDLNKGRPVIYAGYNSKGGNGHAFVLDGYTDDYFHFNWGWGGNANGNYLLSALTPNVSNYSYNQSALMGIEPIQLAQISTSYSEDFETETESEIHLFGRTEISTEERHSGNYSIQLSDSTFSSYSQNTATISFVVPQKGQLSFWIKRYTTDISVLNTQKAVLMSGERNFTLIEIFNGSFNDDDWVNYKVDLSSYEGEIVRFLIIQQNFDFFDKQWMFLDDISITGENQNQEPIIPSKPYPANASVDINFEPTLEWSGGDKNGDSVSYFVYFGETEEPPLVDELVDHKYDPGLLNHSTTYYWKVIADDGDLQTESPLWNFTTDGIPPDVEICGSDSLSSRSINICGRIVNSNGANISSQGICWSENPNPSIDDDHFELQSNDSIFNSTITGLKPYTKYFFKAYAISDEGVGYSNDSFVQTNTEIPKVTIKRVTKITRTSAIVSGTIEELNDSLITERGVIWSLNEDFEPNSLSVISQYGNWDKAIDYSVIIEGIFGPVSVYFKVFAKNSLGISYSEPSMFEAFNTPPTIDLDADDSSGKLGNNYKGYSTEQQLGGSVVDKDVLIFDVDDDTIQQISLVLSNQLIDIDEYLFIPSNILDISVEGNYSDSLVLKNTSFKNNNEFEKILTQVEYWINTDAPDITTIREVNILINDGFDDSKISTSFMQIIPVNDAPVNLELPTLNIEPLHGNTVSVVQGTWVDTLDNCTSTYDYEYKWQKKNGDEIIDIEDESYSNLVIGDSLCGYEIRVVETVIDDNCGGDKEAVASMPGNWHPVGKVKQTIVFVQIPDQNYSNIPYLLTAYSSAELPLTYETNSTDIVDISTDSVFFKTTGAADILCYQKGSACYIPSDTLNRALVVNYGLQEINIEPFNTVKISEQFRIFNALSSAGFPLSVTSSDSAIAYVSNDTILFKGIGSVELFFSQSGNEYIKEAETVSFTFEVLKGDQFINVSIDTLFQYGNELITYTAEASSSLNVDIHSSNISVIEIVGDLLKIEGVGSCVLTFAHPGDDLYYPAKEVLVEIQVAKGNQIAFFELSEELRYGKKYGFKFHLSTDLTAVLSSLNTSVIEVTNDSIIVNGVGSTSISCSQAGNDLWNEMDTLFEIETHKGIQIITVNDSILKHYGDPDFDIDAQVNSGLALVYTPIDTSLVSFIDGQFSISGVGETKINVLQLGNELWERVEEEIQLIVLKGIQAIEFDSIAKLIFGIKPIELTAITSSGLDVTFESSNNKVAEIDGKQLIVRNAGETQISALQPGNNIWEAAETISQNIVIDKASQTIVKNISDTLYSNQQIHFSDFISTSGLPIDEIVSSNQSVIVVSSDSIWVNEKGAAKLHVFQSGNDNYLLGEASFNFVVTYPLGISTFKQNIFSIFPNPATDLIHLTIDGQVEYPLDLILVSAIGQVKLRKELKKPFNVIDISRIPKGIYFVVIRSDKYYKIEKLIVK